MEKYVEKITILEKEICVRDEELKLAATYGKQLLEGKAKLQSQIDALKQENYSFQIKLEAKLKSSENERLEIECQKDTINENESEIQYLKKEHQIMNKKLQEKISENEEFKKMNEEFIAANSTYKAQILKLQNELNTYQEQIQISLNETNSEEFQKITSELQKCKEEKMALLSQLSETEIKLDKLKSQEDKYISLIESLKQSLEDRDYEIQSYSVMVQKAREENSELLGQIEILKLEQTDINRKGNSVFSEVEDRRVLVEKELIILRKKYEAVQENYDIRLMELRKVKHQMSIFLGMFSQNADHDYMEHLENSLRKSQREIEYLSKRLDEHLQLQDSFAETPILNTVTSQNDEYNYLRALLSESQKKNDKLERELQSQRMLKLIESDELIQTKKSLYRSEKNCENLKGEVLQLQLKLQDALMKPGDEKQESKVRKETIPGHIPIEQKQDVSLNSSKKIKEIRSCKKPQQKENINLFEALKCPSSTNKVSNAKKGTSFSAIGDSIIQDSVDKSKNLFKHSKKTTTPVTDMKNDKSECKQQ